MYRKKTIIMDEDEPDSFAESDDSIFEDKKKGSNIPKI